MGRSWQPFHPPRICMSSQGLVLVRSTRSQWASSRTIPEDLSLLKSLPPVSLHHILMCVMCFFPARCRSACASWEPNSSDIVMPYMNESGPGYFHSSWRLHISHGLDKEIPSTSQITQADRGTTEQTNLTVNHGMTIRWKMWLNPHCRFTQFNLTVFFAKVNNAEFQPSLHITIESIFIFHGALP